MKEFEKVGAIINNTLILHLRRLHQKPFPYQNLLIKLLAQALDDWFTKRGHLLTNNGYCNPKKAEIAENAHAWIMSDVEWFGVKKGRRGGTISFISVCQALDFDPQAIRQVLYVKTFKDLEKLDRVYLSSRSRGGDPEDSSRWDPSVSNDGGVSGCIGRGRLCIRTTVFNPDD